MRVKKALVVGVSSVMLSLTLTAPVFAHGCHGGRKAASTACEVCVCTLEDCTKTGLHYHDGVKYCGYNHSSGYCDGTCITVRKAARRRCHSCY